MAHIFRKAMSDLSVTTLSAALVAADPWIHSVLAVTLFTVFFVLDDLSTSGNKATTGSRQLAASNSSSAASINLSSQIAHHPVHHNSTHHNHNSTHHKPHAPCALQLHVAPTSAASLLLINATMPTNCGSRPIVEVLLQPAGSEWQVMPQIGKHGEALPLELGGAHCSLGCRIAARTRDGQVLNATAISRADNAAARNASSTRNASLVVVTPPPRIPPMHFPSARIELLLRPPLAAPFEISAKQVVSQLLSQLDDHYFELHSSQGHERIRLAEVSSTGAFVMLDVVPEDIFVYVSGPDVQRILLRLALRADQLNLTNHFLDPRVGLWRQATPKQDAAIHRAMPAVRLWPHEVEHGEGSHSLDEHPTGASGILHDLLHGGPKDTGNNNHGGGGAASSASHGAHSSTAASSTASDGALHAEGTHAPPPPSPSPPRSVAGDDASKSNSSVSGVSGSGSGSGSGSSSRYSIDGSRGGSSSVAHISSHIAAWLPGEKLEHARQGAASMLVSWLAVAAGAIVLGLAGFGAWQLARMSGACNGRAAPGHRPLGARSELELSAWGGFQSLEGLRSPSMSHPYSSTPASSLGSCAWTPLSSTSSLQSIGSFATPVGGLPGRAPVAVVSAPTPMRPTSSFGSLSRFWEEEASMAR